MYAQSVHEAKKIQEQAWWIAKAEFLSHETGLSIVEFLARTFRETAFCTDITVETVKCSKGPQWGGCETVHQAWKSWQWQDEAGGQIASIVNFCVPPRPALKVISYEVSEFILTNYCAGELMSLMFSGCLL